MSLLNAVLAATLLITPPASADNPWERGPDPTMAVLQADSGPFAIAETVVDPASVTGFGGASIYYPTDTSQGTFGGVAVAPGFLAPRSTLSWIAQRVASHGFVVISIDTRDRREGPSLRATEMAAALDYLTTTSTVRDRVDPARLGVMGHSMGGGGSLSASVSRPSLQAAVPMTPWHGTKNWSTDRVPTLVIGAENDTVAPVASHAEPFYTSLPATLDKAYLELNAASHSAPTSPNVTVAKYSISWLKRFIDNDTRYDQFLCPAPSGSTIQEYRSTCPYT
jgi:dienelactone hydrolase